MRKPRLDSPRARARFAIVLAAAGLILLAFVYFRMQVLRSGADVLVQHGNRLRAIPLPPARGDILDRDSVLLAGTVEGTALIVMPAPPDSVRARIERLAELLGLPDTWRRHAESVVLESARPFVVSTELRPADVVRLAAARDRLPGLLLEPWPRRTYPAGRATAAVVGSVGFEAWPRGAGENLGGAGAGHVVGRSGLELAFDSLLAGEAGIRYIEMDEAGRMLADPLQGAYREPQPGLPLRTRLDVDLQRRIAELLPAGTRAAAVVLDIGSGDVLALYAHAPAGPQSVEPENDAIARVEPPRAIFQTITAALAFESGRVDLVRPQSIPCRGGMRYGERYFRCWRPEGHGQLALAGAMREACDVYFYQIALRLGLQALLDAGARLGLGATTGLELEEERAGTYPASVGDLAGRLGRAPNPSDALDLGAGNGLNRTTLLRMTHAYAALAAGGGAPAPRLTGDSVAATTWRIELREEDAAALMAMLDSVTARGGAAAAAGAAMSPGTRIRGQVSRARAEPGAPRTSGWFVGTAGREGERDRIAVGVLLDRAPRDDAPAALAGRIADYYLRSTGADTDAAPDSATPPTTTDSGD